MKVCHKIKRSSRPSLWVEIVIARHCDNNFLVEKTTRLAPTLVLLSSDLPPSNLASPSSVEEKLPRKVHAKTCASKITHDRKWRYPLLTEP